MSEVPLYHTAECDPFSRINLPHIIDLRALFAAYLVPLPADFRGFETGELNRLRQS